MQPPKKPPKSKTKNQKKNKQTGKAELKLRIPKRDFFPRVFGWIERQHVPPWTGQPLNEVKIDKEITNIYHPFI